MYIINEFIKERSHPLHLPETVHMLSFQCYITYVQAHEIDLTDGIGLNQKSFFNFMSRQTGGRYFNIVLQMFKHMRLIWQMILDSIKNRLLI